MRQLSPTRRSRRLRAAVAITCATLPCLGAGAVARADDTGGSAPVAREAGLETVTVYARRITPLTQVAATVTVIDAARIEETLASDLREMVRYEPGLAVRNDPFRFGLDTISIRGLGGNRVAVEIDGIPAAPGFAVGSYADSGRAFIDPAFIERTEILRGPASALYGSNAIAGIVAISSWSPRSLIATGSGPAVIRSSAGYDEVDQGWSVSAIGAGATGNGAWLFGYARREAGELDTAADVTPDPLDQVSDSVLAKYVLDTVPGGSLTFTVEGSRLRQDSLIDAFLGTPGRFVNTTALLGDDEAQRGRASVEQRLAPAGSAWDSASWRASWQSTRTDQDTWEERRAVPPRTPAVQLERSFDFDEDRYGLEFVAVRGLDGGTLRHDLTYGVEATRSQLEQMRNGLQTTLPSGATTNVILGESFPLRDLPLTTITEAGVFLQDQVSPAADEGRWTVVPALRVDWYRLEPDADRMYREDNPTARPVGVDDVSLAPKLGATFQATESLTLFAQYAHGYRSPPPEDVNIGLDLPQFRVRAVPNPDLKPEQSDGFEIGARLASDRLSFSASLYQTEYRDFIESKVNLGLDPATGYTLFQSQNVAEARIHGAEVAATARLGAWSSWFDGWTGRIAAAWARGDDLVRDVPLNSVDPPRAVLGLRYDSPAGRWGIESLLSAVEAQREVDRSRADLYRTDGYATLDVLAQLRVTPRLRLNLGLFNLTGEQYTEWTDVRGRVVDDPLLPYYTRPGFNASLALRYDL